MIVYIVITTDPDSTKAAHQILDIKTIKKGTNRQVAQRTQQKLFYTTNPTKISDAREVLAEPPPPKKSSPGRHRGLQAPIPRSVEASAFMSRVCEAWAEPCLCGSRQPVQKRPFLQRSFGQKGFFFLFVFLKSH